MSDELGVLAYGSQDVRNAVLAAMLAEDSAQEADAFTSWKAVDDAAARLAKARRRYDKYVREVRRQSRMAGLNRLAAGPFADTPEPG